MELLLTLITTISISLIDCTWTSFHWKYHLGYEQVKPRIEVCVLENKETVKFALIHEIGHYYWFEYLTREEKQEYRKLYKESLTSDFFMENSKIDTEEDFADNFVLYYADNLKMTFKWNNITYDKKDIISLSKKLEEKVNFIWNLIKRSWK